MEKDTTSPAPRPDGITLKKKGLPKIPINREVSSKNILYPDSSSDSDSQSVEEKEKISLRFPRTPFFPSTKKASPLFVQNSVQILPKKRKHTTYIVISNNYEDAEKLTSSIKGEYHMHVKPNQFISVASEEEFIIVVCTPKTIFDHCRIMNTLIRAQKGKAACVCVLPELNRKAIVDEKIKMMSMMSEDHIIFVSYDKKDPKEITTLEKFWREIDSIIAFNA